MNALEKLKETCERATPGPWKRAVEEQDKTAETWIRGQSGQEVCCRAMRDDAEFIAAARQALPALIELVDTYEKEFARLSQEHKIVFSHGKNIFDARQNIFYARAKIEEAMR